MPDGIVFTKMETKVILRLVENELEKAEHSLAQGHGIIFRDVIEEHRENLNSIREQLVEQ